MAGDGPLGCLAEVVPQVPACDSARHLSLTVVLDVRFSGQVSTATVAESARYLTAGDPEALLDQVEIRVPQPGLQECGVTDVPEPPSSAPGVIGNLREPSREG